ncbi:uncharacterized protein LOC129017802 [Pongo pygmaeus]|uniref:uncharacterized protein LOC129017802 n=1 Tax=Pongo pygmaeus TaxID=9600 RepID=UPI0023E3432C|nr:uncharacterized protein LOC129017802 [Pongo pygmaeus]
MSAAVFFPPSSPLPIVFFPSLLFSVFYPPPYPHLLLAAASSCRAFLSPHQIFSLPLPTVLSPRRPLPTPSSPLTVFSPHRLLPAPSPQPFSSPHTVFFPSHRFLPMSSHRLAGASVSRNLLPTFFSPSPHRLFSQPLISAIFFPSPTILFPFPSPHLLAAATSCRAFLSPSPFSPLPLPTVFAPDRLLAHPLLALSHCLSPRSSPGVRAPVSLPPEGRGNIQRPTGKTAMGQRRQSLELAAYSHGMPRTAGNHQKLRRRFYLKASQRNQSYPHLLFEFLAS